MTEKISRLCSELEERINRKEGVVPEGTPRILLSGCPMAIPNWKLPYIIESSGAVVVVEESCVGTRNIAHLVEESGESIDEMIENIANRYMKIDCACFTPNTERLENVLSLAETYKVDGVIHYSLSFCQLYETEAFKISKALDQKGIPCLSISTDYTMEDVEQLKNRVEAFVEMIKG